MRGGHITQFGHSKRQVVEGNVVTSSKQQYDNNEEELEIHASSYMLNENEELIIAISKSRNIDYNRD